MRLDSQIALYLNKLAGTSVATDWLVIFCAKYLAYFVVGFFFTWLYVSDYSTHAKLSILATTVVAAIIARFGITEILQRTTARPRPFLVHTTHQLVDQPTYSFPSGHASFFFALSTAVYLFDSTWGLYFLFAAAGISIGRVIAGVHYPSDIIVGAVIGSVTAYTVFMWLHF